MPTNHPDVSSETLRLHGHKTLSELQREFAGRPWPPELTEILQCADLVDELVLQQRVNQIVAAIITDFDARLLSEAPHA